jgi:hypothetical protein
VTRLQVLVQALSSLGAAITAPSRAFNTDFGRFYAHPSSGVPTAIGQQVNGPEGPYTPKPSITNILKVMDEGFLPNFYAKLVAEHAVENLGTLRDTTEKFGSSVAAGVLKAVPSRPHPNAAIGDEVHDAIDAFVNDRETPAFSTSTAENMFVQFLHFLSVEAPEIVATEFTVWSYKYGYAGTGDILWRWRDALWIVDTKTGNRVYPKVAMQCTALGNADVILDADGSESPMPHADRYGVFHIRPRSAKLYALQNTDEAFSAFLALKTVFDWQRFHKDSTIPASPLAVTHA